MEIISPSSRARWCIPRSTLCRGQYGRSQSGQTLGGSRSISASWAGSGQGSAPHRRWRSWPGPGAPIGRRSRAVVEVGAVGRQGNVEMPRRSGSPRRAGGDGVGARAPGTPCLAGGMRIPQETLQQWEITDADKAALADLPDAVEPFFQPDLQREAQPTMRGGLYRIANDLGREIGVGARGVLAVDPQHEMPDLFVNSSVADLAEFLRETGSFQAGVAGMHEDEAVARVGEIRERLER